VPSPTGLFHRAISQSDGAQHTLSIEQATGVFAGLGEIIGAKPGRESLPDSLPSTALVGQILPIDAVL